MPIIIFGICVAGLQLSLDLYLRPEAVKIQVADHLGDFGRWFDRTVPRVVWLSTENALLHAQLEFGPPPVLRDFVIYQLAGDGTLRGVIRARTASTEGDVGVWLLQDGRRWSATDHPNTEVEFSEEKIALGIDPVWLANYGIQPKYLLHANLRAINASPFAHNIDEFSNFQTWIELRYARALFAAGLVFFASSLSFVLLTYRTRFQELVLIVAAGYGVHVAMKVLMVLAEYGYVSPVGASWVVPILLLFVSAALIIFFERERLSNGRASA